MPRHADQERPVLAVVGGPSRLLGSEGPFDVLLNDFDVEVGKRLGVIEVFTEGIGFGRVLPQGGEVKLVWPPIEVELALLGVAQRARCHGQGGQQRP